MVEADGDQAFFRFDSPKIQATAMNSQVAAARIAVAGRGSRIAKTITAPPMTTVTRMSASNMIRMYSDSRATRFEGSAAPALPTRIAIDRATVPIRHPVSFAVLQELS